jgi:hypothetical protein
VWIKGSRRVGRSCREECRGPIGAMGVDWRLHDGQRTNINTVLWWCMTADRMSQELGKACSSLCRERCLCHGTDTSVVSLLVDSIRRVSVRTDCTDQGIEGVVVSCSIGGGCQLVVVRRGGLDEAGISSSLELRWFEGGSLEIVGVASGKRCDNQTDWMNWVTVCLALVRMAVMILVMKTVLFLCLVRWYEHTARPVWEACSQLRHGHDALERWLKCWV